MTLFCAIWMSDDVSRRLAALQPSDARGVRLVRRRQFHLTLAYLGRVEPRPAEDALAGVAGDAFDLTLEGVGKFGSPRRRVVLWAGVEPVPPLMDLQARVVEVLRAAGHELEDRAYRPHVTLARCPNGLGRERLTAFLEGSIRSSFRVEGFGLYSSRPGDGGPVYRLEREYLLRT